MITLTPQMRMIFAVEAVWLLLGILFTGVASASLLLWMSFGWVAWSAYSGNLMGTAGADMLLGKLQPYLKWN